MLRIIKNREQSLRRVKIYQVLLLILIGLGGAYVLTRPCNWGSCSPLYESEDLGNHALRRVDLSAAPADLKACKTHLEQAIKRPCLF